MTGGRQGWRQRAERERGEREREGEKEREREGEKERERERGDREKEKERGKENQVCDWRLFIYTLTTKIICILTVDHTGFWIVTTVAPL